MPKRKFYAVAVGFKPGIYEDWEDCKRQVTGFPGNKYKAFSTRSEAEKYFEDSVGCVQIPANLKEASSQPLQTSPFAQPEPFMEIEEEGQHFVVFNSISDFDRYFDFLGSSNKVEDCKTGRRIHASLDCESGIEEQIHVRGGNSQSNDAKPDHGCTTVEKPREAQCKEAIEIVRGGAEFMYFEDEYELEIYLAPFFKADSRPEAVIHVLGSQNCHGAKHKQSHIHTVEPLTFESESLDLEGVFQLEFAGVANGNPGKAGAGALLRCPDGSTAFELMECLGITTNNVAEYVSLILGLRGAIAKGVKKIKVQGDSKLLCLQVSGVWKLKNKQLIPLHNTVKQLEGTFEEFSTIHVSRDFNSAAHTLANDAVYRPETDFCHEFVPNATFSRLHKAT